MSDERTRRLRELVYGLAEQQAMADDWWRPKLAAIEAETGVLLAGLLQELSTHRHIMHDQEWVPFGAIESAFHRAVLDTEGDRQAYIPNRKCS
jgi:hypothetical protein